MAVIIAERQAARAEGRAEALREREMAEHLAFIEGRDGAIDNAAMKAYDMGRPDIREAINALVPDRHAHTTCPGCQPAPSSGLPASVVAFPADDKADALLSSLFVQHGPKGASGLPAVGETWATKYQEGREHLEGVVEPAQQEVVIRLTNVRRGESVRWVPRDFAHDWERIAPAPQPVVNQPAAGTVAGADASGSAAVCLCCGGAQDCTWYVCDACYKALDYGESDEFKALAAAWDAGQRTFVLTPRQPTPDRHACPTDGRTPCRTCGMVEPPSPASRSDLEAALRIAEKFVRDYDSAVAIAEDLRARLAALPAGGK